MISVSRSRVALVTALVFAAVAGHAVTVSHAAESAAHHSDDNRVAGLPGAALPDAALGPEPALAVPATWPFGEGFPRTSGTGRVAGGAFFWTDFVLDDHGALGVRAAAPRPTRAEGTYLYPASPRFSGNAADLFRVAVGLDNEATWWRVDWTTLVDTDVPIAAFAFDTDDDTDTGGSAWPGGAGVRSAGIDAALVVSGTGAWLVDVGAGNGAPATPVEDLGGALHVDLDARSFVVELPREALPPTESWEVRVAAGLADAEGDGFAAVGSEDGALPGQPAVYNVGFRAADVEDGAWKEEVQARALAAGDVTGFSAHLDWSRLASREVEPEPLPSGASNRWYVSAENSVQGVRPWRPPVPPPVEPTDPLHSAVLEAVGQVQPYAVYVPESYDGSKPVPLTIFLHSLHGNHNQYTPDLPGYDLMLEDACDDRGSICVTALGRSTSASYRYETPGALDLWEVWRSVAAHYRIDPDATVVTGFSEGGIGAWDVAARYPDAFAGVAPFAGSADFQRFPTTVGNLSLLENLRWTPAYVNHGVADELVPVTNAVNAAERLDALGYRYLFDLQAADHVGYALVFRWARAADYLDGLRREAAPRHVTFRWRPYEADDADPRIADLGVGPSGAWWVRDVEARGSFPDAVVDAVSRALPTASTTTRRSDGVAAVEPTVARWQRLDWEAGAALALEPAVDVSLTNVGRVTLALDEAGLRDGGGVVSVESDGSVVVTLDGLLPGTRVRHGESTTVIDVDGRFTSQLSPGTTVLSVVR